MSLRPGRLLRSLLILLAGLGIMVSAPSTQSHDLPDELMLQAFVKPEPSRLNFVVRLPLSMLLNIGLPKRGPGYIDLAESDAALARAAAAAADALALFENEQRLAPDASSSRLSARAAEPIASARWGRVARRLLRRLPLPEPQAPLAMPGRTLG